MNTIRKYELIEQLGEGGMGVVWKARDTELLSEVVIKCIRAEHCDNARIRQRFIDEARLSFTLVHQNVCALKDAFDHESQLYLVQEYVPGETVQQRMDNAQAPMPPATVVSIVKQVLDGLAYTHRRKVVHCDIKPANIMVSDITNDTGELLIEVKIIDFGIARALETAVAHETGTHSRIGTPRYMSPEQYQGKQFDHRTDFFSLGCVLHDMLCSGRDAAVTEADLHTGVRPLPLARITGLPDEYEYLNDVIACATASNPDERYATAQEFAGALLKCPAVPHFGWIEVADTRAFRTSETPVTAGQFKKFLSSWAAQKHSDPTLIPAQRKIWTTPGYTWFASRAALTELDPDDEYACVTWWEAVAYCNWLAHCRHSYSPDPSKFYAYRKDGNVRYDTGVRLPSEYEWRHAAATAGPVLWPDAEDAWCREWTTDGWVAEWQYPSYVDPRTHIVQPLHAQRTVLKWVRGGVFPRLAVCPADLSHKTVFRCVTLDANQ